MTNVLVVQSSALAGDSVSNRITQALVEAMGRIDPSSTFVTRDVGADPLPHLTAERLPGVAGHGAGPVAAEAKALADALIAEVQAADILVIASPMYNFGITSTLKAWFDHVLRAGTTFRYTANGSQGLLTGKRALVVETRGGLYTDGPTAASDHQEPHLKTLLGFIGITDVSFLRAEKLAVSPDAKEASIATALETVDGVAAAILTSAQGV